MKKNKMIENQLNSLIFNVNSSSSSALGAQLSYGLKEKCKKNKAATAYSSGARKCLGHSLMLRYRSMDYEET